MQRITTKIQYLMYVLICLTYITGCNGFSEKPIFTKGFIKYFGQSGTNELKEVIQSTDGGYMFIGTSAASGSKTDIMVVKTDLAGNKIWTKYFGSVGSDTGSSILPASDGNYLLIGTVNDTSLLNNTSSSNTNELTKSSIYIAKINIQGNLIWETTISDPSNRLFGYNIEEKNGIINIIGATTFDGDFRKRKILVKKLNSNGSVNEFNYVPSGILDNDNYGFSVTQGNDNSLFCVANSTLSLDGFQGTPIFVKISGNGGEIFAYNRREPVIDINTPPLPTGIEYMLTASKCLPTSDGGYIVSGNSIKSSDLNRQAYLLKLDVSGRRVWYKSYGGNLTERAHAVYQTKDGGYILVGEQEITSLNSDVWIVKTSELGEIQWTKTYGGAKRDRGTSVKETTDGGYIVSAVFTIENQPVDISMGTIIKLDNEGNITNY